MGGEKTVREAQRGRERPARNRRARTGRRLQRILTSNSRSSSSMLGRGGRQYRKDPNSSLSGGAGPLPGLGGRGPFPAGLCWGHTRGSLSRGLRGPQSLALPPGLTLAGRWKPARCRGASGCRGVELSRTWGAARGVGGGAGTGAPSPGRSYLVLRLPAEAAGAVDLGLELACEGEHLQVGGREARVVPGLLGEFGHCGRETTGPSSRAGLREPGGAGPGRGAGTRGERNRCPAQERAAGPARHSPRRSSSGRGRRTRSSQGSAARRRRAGRSRISASTSGTVYSASAMSCGQRRHTGP